DSIDGDFPREFLLQPSYRKGQCGVLLMNLFQNLPRLRVLCSLELDETVNVGIHIIGDRALGPCQCYKGLDSVNLSFQDFSIVQKLRDVRDGLSCMDRISLNAVSGQVSDRSKAIPFDCALDDSAYLRHFCGRPERADRILKRVD